MKKFNEFYKVLNDEERSKIIQNASSAFANFLESLKIDWKSDPETIDTPMRVAEMYVNDLLRGRFTKKPESRNLEIDQVDSLVLKIFGPITVKSLCIHHCMPFTGSVIIGLNSASNIGLGLGISKYAEICHWYTKRGQIQEKLGDDIRNELARLHTGVEVAVFIRAKHSCFSNRDGGDCCSKLYTIHTTDNFSDHNIFFSSCMMMV